MSSETQTHRESLLLSRKFRRIVVKIGSGVLADAEEGLRVPFIRALAVQVAQAWEERGIAFVVVTSGAIAAGRKKMGMGEKPRGWGRSQGRWRSSRRQPPSGRRA